MICRNIDNDDGIIGEGGGGVWRMRTHTISVTLNISFTTHVHVATSMVV